MVPTLLPSRRAALVVFAGALLGAPVAAAPVPEAKKPKVEVIFCLDTTGSMGGLIEGAKQKIWAISNQIASGKPIPELKIGLVAYRDRGDAYITKVFDLSDDLDAIHGHLKGFQAQGGGDAPESVNQALFDAVHKVKWSTDKTTLRIIFLVGDAPPHMDYPDDVKYPETCKKACEKGIIINTVQCGNDGACQAAWRDICVKAEGSYVQIAQDGGVTPVVATPFDKRLGEINDELAHSTLVFGDPRRQAADREKVAAATGGLAAPAKAERAAYNAKNDQAAAYDLLDSIKQKKVKLEELKKDQLPKPLQGKSLEEQKKYLAELDKKRTTLNKEALDLDKKRSDYIAKKQAESAAKGKQGFDQQVLEILRNQAKNSNIKY
jgi:hypothetical protein